MKQARPSAALTDRRKRASSLRPGATTCSLSANCRRCRATSDDDGGGSCFFPCPAAMEESSTHSSQRSVARSYQGMGPPVPYCEGPYDYEPAVMCKCGLKAARYTAWTTGNPGRRFYRCRRARSPEDCGFYEWLDPVHKPHMAKLLLDLRDMVYSLRNENADLQLQLKEMNEVLIIKTESLKEMQRKLAGRDAIQQAMPRKISAGNCSCFIVVVLALLIVLVLSLAGSV